MDRAHGVHFEAGGEDGEGLKGHGAIQRGGGLVDAADEQPFVKVRTRLGPVFWAEGFDEGE